MATSPSGKQYIGITHHTTEIRWKRHTLQAKCGSTYPVHSAIRKYGASNFEVVTLANGDWPSLNEAETAAIKVFRTQSPCGYNLRAGGEQSEFHPETLAKMSAAGRDRRHSAETRARMSAAHRGLRKSAKHRANLSAAMKGRTFGRVLSAETRARIGASHRGRHESSEHRANISAALKGRIMSTESRAKMSASHRGKKLSPESIVKRTATRAANRLARKQATLNPHSFSC